MLTEKEIKNVNLKIPKNYFLSNQNKSRIQTKITFNNDNLLKFPKEKDFEEKNQSNFNFFKNFNLKNSAFLKEKINSNLMNMNKSISNPNLNIVVKKEESIEENLPQIFNKSKHKMSKSQVNFKTFFSEKMQKSSLSEKKSSGVKSRQNKRVVFSRCIKDIGGNFNKIDEKNFYLKIDNGPNKCANASNSTTVSNKISNINVPTYQNKLNSSIPIICSNFGSNYTNNNINLINISNNYLISNFNQNIQLFNNLNHNENKNHNFNDNINQNKNNELNFLINNNQNIIREVNSLNNLNTISQNSFDEKESKQIQKSKNFIKHKKQHSNIDKVSLKDDSKNDKNNNNKEAENVQIHNYNFKQEEVKVIHQRNNSNLIKNPNLNLNNIYNNKKSSRNNENIEQYFSGSNSNNQRSISSDYSINGNFYNFFNENEAIKTTQINLIDHIANHPNHESIEKVNGDNHNILKENCNAGTNTSLTIKKQINDYRMKNYICIFNKKIKFDEPKKKSVEKIQNVKKKIRLPNFSRPNFYFDKNSLYKNQKQKDINYFYSFKNSEKEHTNNLPSNTSQNNIMNNIVNLKYHFTTTNNISKIENKASINKTNLQKVHESLKVKEIFENLELVSIIDDFEKR